MTDAKVESWIRAHEGTGNGETTMCSALRELLELRRAARAVLPLVPATESDHEAVAAVRRLVVE